MSNSHHKTRSLSFLQLNKLALYTVKEEFVIGKYHRGKASSIRISPSHKKLEEDYQIFQFMKTDRTQQVSVHLTSVPPLKFRRTPLTTPQKGTPTIDTQSTERQPTKFKNKKSYVDLRLERYQNEMQQVQSKRKQMMLQKADNMLKQDMKDINKMSESASQQFQNRVALYSKYFSQELMSPVGYRKEDMAMPIHKYSNIENPNKFRQLFKSELPAAQLSQPLEVVDQLLPLEGKANKLTQNLHKMNLKLIKKVQPEVLEFMNQIQSGNIIQVESMLDLNSELINSKTNLLESPLHLAVKRNQIKIIELLIRNHVDESLKDLWGRTARQLAFKCQNFQAMKLLAYEKQGNTQME